MQFHHRTKLYIFSIEFVFFPALLGHFFCVNENEAKWKPISVDMA